MPLTDDTARCHDARCEVRQYCARWIYRGTGGQRVVHAYTLRPQWQPHDELCDRAITEDELNEPQAG